VIVRLTASEHAATSDETFDQIAANNEIVAALCGGDD
jgi:hypothetical protein